MGHRHEVDFLTKVRLCGCEAFVLAHVENQATAETDFPKRMFRYFAMLHRKFDLPIFPIALFSYDRPTVAVADAFRVKLECQRILVLLKRDLVRSSLLIAFVKSYRALTASEKLVYDRELELIHPSEKEIEIQRYVTEWEEDGIA